MSSSHSNKKHKNGNNYGGYQTHPTRPRPHTINYVPNHSNHSNHSNNSNNMQYFDILPAQQLNTNNIISNNSNPIPINGNNINNNGSNKRKNKKSKSKKRVYHSPKMNGNVGQHTYDQQYYSNDSANESPHNNYVEYSPIKKDIIGYNEFKGYDNEREYSQSLSQSKSKSKSKSKHNNKSSKSKKKKKKVYQSSSANPAFNHEINNHNNMQYNSNPRHSHGSHSHSHSKKRHSHGRHEHRHSNHNNSNNNNNNQHRHSHGSHGHTKHRHQSHHTHHPHQQQQQQQPYIVMQSNTNNTNEPYIPYQYIEDEIHGSIFEPQNSNNNNIPNLPPSNNNTHNHNHNHSSHNNHHNSRHHSRRDRSATQHTKARSRSPQMRSNNGNNVVIDRSKILASMKNQSQSDRVVHHNMIDVQPKKKKSKLNKGKLAEEYFIKEKLGKGNFAVVRRVIKKTDGKEYAAKIISKKHLSEAEKEELDNECKILAKLNHPNIVGFSTIIQTPRHLYIVLELLTGGELFDRIIQKGKFTETEAANIAKQIADALCYLHENGIVHRDLKPENIIYENKSDNAKIKITDFGLGRDLSDTPNGSMKTACGTPGYVAPEILKGGEYDEYVDLWSTGVIIYILLCGYPPFQGATGTNQMYKKIKRGQYSFPSPAWDNISLIAQDCIRGLLTVDPKLRMSGKQLLQHPWIIQSTKKLKNKKSEVNLINKAYSNLLSNYIHRKKFRRGVSLVITLNRMIRAAGLEKVAREQRIQFRKRLKAYKKKLKDQQKRIYDLQQQQKKNGIQPKDFIYEEIVDPNITPQIDFSIFN